MLPIARKRNASDDQTFASAKKFKDFIESDDEYSDNELQIDLDLVPPSEEQIKEINVTRSRPVHTDYLNVTLPNGNRCYIKVDESENYVKPTMFFNSFTASPNYYKLLDEAEELFKKKKEISNINIDNFEESSNVLWVTKYAPKKYVDLLSSETVNRNLLSWLKSWDKHVFYQHNKFIDKLILNFENSCKGTNFEEILQINPKDGMPVKKVVLISGPPGLGKTTLAQIIAKHCGYYPIEINASDDRSPENFKNRIEALNDTRLGKSKGGEQEQLMKPCCLILDEIDGTGAAAVNVLINAILASNKTEKTAQISGKKKDKSSLKVNRPIICICNDLYAPSLRQLRPLCYIIKIQPPDYNQLFHRLNDIAKMENMECDRGVLTNIIDSSNRDIRSCLNTLQFLKQKGIKGTINNTHLSNIGQKDIEIGAFKVWQDIFTEPNLKASRLLINGKNNNELHSRSKQILAMSHSVGDMDKIISGVYENYLSVVKFKDIFLKGMVDAAEWFAFNDMANTYISTKQIYEMFKYKQYVIPFFHLSFASSAISPRSIQWPVTESNAYFNHQKMKSICDSFVSNQGYISSWIQSKQDVLQIILPYLVNIIRPNDLRPINTQLYSTKEKIILQNTVNTMISTGLGYTQERLAELQYQYVLNPNIEEITKFNLNGVFRKELSYSTKQLIANEIIREKIKRSDIHRYKDSDETVSVLNEFSINRIGFIMQKANEIKNKTLSNNQNKNKESFNFRLGSKVSNVKKDEIPSAISIILNQPVWFKFKEGFSNAIKRPVKMKDL